MYGQKYDDVTRPFAFEDLEGAPEPERWGPRYSKPAKPTANKAVDRFPTNCASGQKHDFDAAKYRKQLRARFEAVCNADRRAWAADNSKEKHAAYAEALREKRARNQLLEAA